VPEVESLLGSDRSQWVAREVGDGNLNAVYIVGGEAGSLVVKQALPYLRLLGESWPLPLERSYIEYLALTEQAVHDGGRRASPPRPGPSPYGLRACGVFDRFSDPRAASVSSPEPETARRPSGVTATA
jgi:hypothetical protein